MPYDIGLCYALTFSQLNDARLVAEIDDELTMNSVVNHSSSTTGQLRGRTTAGGRTRRTTAQCTISRHASICGCQQRATDRQPCSGEATRPRVWQKRLLVPPAGCISMTDCLSRQHDVSWLALFRNVDLLSASVLWRRTTFCRRGKTCNPRYWLQFVVPAEWTKTPVKSGSQKSHFRIMTQISKQLLND